jgi:hypothetical protein
LRDFDDQFLFSFVLFHICFIILLLTWSQFMKSLSRTRMWSCNKNRLICHQIICYWLWIKIVSSLQLVTRNVVTVNYVDAWVRWWMILIKSYLKILYSCFLKSFHMLNISLTCYMIDSSHNHKMSSNKDVNEMIIDSWMNH